MDGFIFKLLINYTSVGSLPEGLSVHGLCNLIMHTCSEVYSLQETTISSGMINGHMSVLFDALQSRFKVYMSQ